MPVLSNARHELFAQAVSNGRKLDEAYSDAGYLKRRGNPSRLRHVTSIDRRIAEILTERAEKASEKSAREAVYTREVLLAQLEDAREIARKAMNGSAMAMATMGMAKILGLIVDRREVGDAGSFDKMTDDELEAAVKKSAGELGLEVPDNLLQFRKSEP